MNAPHKNRVVELSASIGTGAYLLSGAVLGYQTMLAAGCIAGELYDYFAEAIDANGALTGAFEVGTGIYTLGELNSVDVFASSNAGLKVDWGYGTKRVSLALTAEYLATLDTGVSVVNAATRLIQTQRIMAKLVSRGQI